MPTDANSVLAMTPIYQAEVAERWERVPTLSLDEIVAVRRFWADKADCFPYQTPLACADLNEPTGLPSMTRTTQ